MAQIGLKNIYFAKLTKDNATGVEYETPVKIGNAISVDINPSVNKQTLYGDDMPVATNSNITEIAVTIETTEITLEQQATLLGHTYDSSTKTVTAYASDDGSYGALLFESDTHDGKTRCVKLLKGKFALTQETINTRGENLNYQVPKLEGNFVARQYDQKWKVVKDVDSGTSTASWYTSVETTA